MKRIASIAAAYLVLATAGRGHTDTATAMQGALRKWDFDPWVIVPLFLTLALYVGGLRALRRATARPQKLRRESWLFFAGWATLVVALVSPVHALSGELFYVHMTQHELLMIVAAPLLILGRPALVTGWAFPRRLRRGAVGAIRSAGCARAWDAATNPWAATLVHAAALWVWHVPLLFDATLRHDGIHALQHVSFTGTALLFWQAVLHGRNRKAGYGVAVLMLFFTACHSGALGALLTFASRVWYAGYANPATDRALSALEDQQLGGLIMWVPAGLVYVAAGLALFAGWLRESERLRNRHRGERSGAAPTIKCAVR